MDLGDWRSRINDIDNQILHLLNQRAEGAPRVGRSTLPASRALEPPLTVAYLAPPATFTHQAARERFGDAAEYHPSRTIAEIFDDVERGGAAFGVVPVENSTDGAVNVTLDRLVHTELLICGELTLEIAQHLLTRATELADVKRGLSHPQGLGRCTAGAAELAAADPHVAAIASELAGRLYGVPILRRRIEDNPHNATRFLVLGRRASGPSGRDKTSILFAMPNQPGALSRILEPFARAGLNLTKIESRPAKRMPWEFVMFVDFEGHRDTPVVADALRQAAERTVYLKVLGSYPAA